MTELVEQFLRTDAAAVAITHDEHEREISRRDLADALRTAQDDLAAAVAAADSAIDAAASAVDEAQSALTAAESKLRDARFSKLQRTEQPRNRVDSITRQLRALDPPAIVADFQEWLAAELEQLRHRKPSTLHQSQPDRFGNAMQVAVESDSASLHRRNLALLSARDAVDALLLSPPDDWATEVDRLRDSIPAVAMEAIK